MSASGTSGIGGGEDDDWGDFVGEVAAPAPTPASFVAASESAHRNAAAAVDAVTMPNL